MKLIRFGEPGRERPGLFLDDARAVDVAEFGSDYDESFFAGGGVPALRAWAAVNAASAPAVPSHQTVMASA